MCLGASGIATGYPLDTVKVLIILSLPWRIVTPLVLLSGADANTSCLLNWREKVSVDLPDDQQACLLRKGGIGKKGWGWRCGRDLTRLLEDFTQFILLPKSEHVFPKIDHPTTIS